MPLRQADVQPGDELRVCVDEAELLRAGAFAYLAPALLAVIGAALADASGAGGDLAAAGAALLGFLAGLLAARFLAPTPRIRTSRITSTSGEPA